VTTQPPFTAEQIRDIFQNSPYHRWLGLKVVKADDTEVELRIAWREEFVANPESGEIHGGIILALIDLAADCAVAMHTGRPVPTVNLRVDYHSGVAPKDHLTARGRIVKLGRTNICGEAEIYDEDDRMIASGRGVYFLPPDRGGQAPG
jgi:uncharacterized protein (TIGR00369 family)